MKLFIFIFLCLSIGNTYSFTEVKFVKGKASFQNKSIKVGDKFETSGLLKTGKNSVVKLEIKKWNSTIILSPNSSFEINPSKEVKKKATLLEGLGRWITHKNKKSKGIIFTRNATFGVRGTDYLVKSNSLLGESEVVVFDGKVEMTNIKDQKNSFIITKNQWGGLGGRFGTKIKKPLDLPEKVIKSFKQLIKVK